MTPVTRQGPNIPPNNTNPNNMTPESVQAMIDQALLQNSTNRDGSHSSHEYSRSNVQTARPCFYADFMKCQPLNFKGTEGVLDKIFRLDAYLMTWEVLKKKITDKYCPQGEIKKLEIELWNLKKGRRTTKRKADDSFRNNHGHQQQPAKRQNVAKIYNMGLGERKPYGRNFPNSKAFQKRLPKAEDKDEGNVNAQGWVYAVGNAKKKKNASRDPDSNVITEKVVVSSDSEGSEADDFSELKKITALLAKAFNRRKFYSKPTNNNLRTSSSSQSANKKQEFVKIDNKRVEKKDDEKKRDMGRVKCYNCKKEGHFAKDCKKAKEINANMVFMAQIEKVLSDSEASSSSADEKISEVSYYLSESESESEFETSEYYDNSTYYGLFLNNDDDQEIFHDAIESASENFIENHIDSQKDYDKSDVDHNDSEEKDQLVLKDQLQVKHIVIDTHVECQEKYAKLEVERYEYMIRYSAYFGNDKQHRKHIVDQQVLFDKMSVQIVELDKHVRDLKKPVLERLQNF
nr:hypothetical protein [Tanacetum cinerariifolium]